MATRLKRWSKALGLTGLRLSGFGALGCLSLALLMFMFFGAMWLLSFVIFGFPDREASRSVEVEDDLYVQLAPGAGGRLETYPSFGFVDSDELEPIYENEVRLVSFVDPYTPPAGTAAASPGHRWIAAEVAVTNIGERNRRGGGDFGSSFSIATVGGAEAVPIELTARVLFEVPNEASIDWLKFNPTLLARSVYFER